MTDESSMPEEEYRIDSVQPSDPPTGMTGTDWYCYVIVQGTNSIRGYRTGSRRAVMTAVEEIILQLNERRFGKRGRAKKAAPKVAPKAASK